MKLKNVKNIQGDTLYEIETTETTFRWYAKTKRVAKRDGMAWAKLEGKGKFVQIYPVVGY